MSEFIAVLVGLLYGVQSLVCPYQWIFFEGRCWWHRQNTKEKTLADDTVNTESGCFTKETDAALVGFAVVSRMNLLMGVNISVTHECILNDSDKHGNDELFVSTRGNDEVKVDYYENRCSQSQQYGEISENGSEHPVITQSENCFDRLEHSSLVGFADRVESNIKSNECLSECAQCIDCLDDEPCNAFVYYKAQRQCIMMVETRTGNEEYFVRGDFEADYYERRKNCNKSDICVEEVF
ncbi:hypothetical protein Tcan_07647 [Toxocara canis]|uniref:Apple domain-containing protein n=1 Tax=Toxocara canis TaxID=6265 RepID=A0A0B2V8X8_TOXCA|nr:hypothetical protein Tcan_07647 [Toxocara canis]